MIASAGSHCCLRKNWPWTCYAKLVQVSGCSGCGADLPFEEHYAKRKRLQRSVKVVVVIKLSRADGARLRPDL